MKIGQIEISIDLKCFYLALWRQNLNAIYSVSIALKYGTSQQSDRLIEAKMINNIALDLRKCELDRLVEVTA